MSLLSQWHASDLTKEAYDTKIVQNSNIEGVLAKLKLQISSIET